MPLMDPTMNARRDQVAAAKINVSQAFRAGVIDLHLVADPGRYPDYRVFQNLKRIHADHSPALWPRLDLLLQHSLPDAWVKSVVVERLEGRPVTTTTFPGLSRIPYLSSAADEADILLVLQYYKDKERSASGTQLIVHQTFRDYDPDHGPFAPSSEQTVSK